MGLSVTLAALTALLPLAVAGSAPRQEPTPVSAPFQRGSLERARSRARVADRQLLLVFLGPDCPPCEALETETLGDPRVRDWAGRRVVGVRTDDEDEELARRYRVSTRPTLLLVGADDQETGRIEGFVEPAALLQQLEALLAGVNGLEAARSAVEKAPRDPEAHLRLAHALGNRRRFPESLEELLWVFDHTRGDPTWEARRFEEVLREVAIMRRSLPAATTSVKERRDRAAATLIDAYDPETPVAELTLTARELRALNGAVGDTRHTLFAWDVLRAREGFPRAVTEELFEEGLLVLLVTDRRYADALEGLGDPVAIVQERLSRLQELRRRAAEEPEAGLKPQIEHNLAVNEAGRCYEILLGAGSEKDAEDLVELVLGLESSAQAYVALMRGAKQAGRTEQGRELLQRGLEALEDAKERERLRRVGAQLLGQGR